LEQFLSVPEKYYHKSTVFVKYFFPFCNRFVFYAFFDASVGKPALASTVPKMHQMHERPPDIRRALGIRDLVYFA